MVGAEFVMNTVNIDRPTILQALLNQDGSCRDFNFAEKISRHACINIIDSIKRNWNLHECRDANGETISSELIASYLEHETGSLHLIWTSDTKSPSHLQTYVFFDASGCFCELTFFPDDCHEPHFELNEFLQFLGGLVGLSESEEYYLRYEDASWHHGLNEEKESVIFSNLNFTL